MILSSVVRGGLRLLRAMRCLALLAASTALSVAAARAGTVTSDQMWVTTLKVPVYSDLRVADNKVYLTSTQPNGPNVFALSAATGKVDWKFATNGAIAIPPTVGPDQVFVASDIGNTHFMRALNAKTGDLVWQYTRNQPPECMCSHPSVLDSGLLFAQTDGHGLYAFAPYAPNVPSRRIWQFVGDGAKLTPPTVADGLVTFGSADHKLYALDAKTGKTSWVAATGYGFVAQPLVVDGLVIAGNRGGTLYAYDLKSGKSAWSFSTNGAIDTKPLADGGRLYLVSEDRTLSALDTHTGKLIWQTNLLDYSASSPIIASDDVIVADRAGDLVSFDARTGHQVWKTELRGTPFSQPHAWYGEIVLKVGDHEVAGYAMASGHERWRYQRSSVVTAPAFGNNAIFVAASSGRVVALKEPPN
jgi:eukaryotic-like serine/threonine-protein kinase